jgi:hypothetical protein
MGEEVIQDYETLVVLAKKGEQNPITGGNDIAAEDGSGWTCERPSVDYLKKSLFKMGSQHVIHRFETGEHVPIVMRKAHDQEKSPNGAYRPDILGVFEQ